MSVERRMRTPWVAEEWGGDAVVRRSDGSRIVIGDALYHPENMDTARWIAASVDRIAALEKVEAAARTYLQTVDHGDTIDGAYPMLNYAAAEDRTREALRAALQEPIP